MKPVKRGSRFVFKISYERRKRGKHGFAFLVQTGHLVLKHCVELSSKRFIGPRWIGKPLNESDGAADSSQLIYHRAGKNIEVIPNSFKLLGLLNFDLSALKSREGDLRILLKIVLHDKRAIPYVSYQKIRSKKNGQPFSSVFNFQNTFIKTKLRRCSEPSDPRSNKGDTGCNQRLPFLYRCQIQASRQPRPNNQADRGKNRREDYGQTFNLHRLRLPWRLSVVERAAA
jgi:hypothetical protein